MHQDPNLSTPPLLAAEMVSRAAFPRGGVVLEPSAGDGALIDAIVAAGGFVVYCERDLERRLALFARLPAQTGMVLGDDFLTYDPRGNGTFEGFDAVVMHPPFEQSGKGDALDHVKHAWSLLKPGCRLVAILPREVETSYELRDAFFREWCRCNGTLERLPDDVLGGVLANLLVLEKGLS